MRSTFIIGALAASLLAAPAFAQTPAPAAPSSSPSMSAPAGSGMGASTTKMDKASRSKACSAEADQKGLHGKARKKFRSACKRGRS